MGFTKAVLALQLLLSSISTAAPTGLVGLESKAAKVTIEGSTIYDAVVVGGGPAGLSAVSGLARVRRNVLLIDSGEYRNDPTRHMHDVIGTDGVAPAFFRWKARGQLAYYQSATLINGTVTKIDAATSASGSSAAQDAPFTVRATFPSGEETIVGARGIILATGLTDIIPSTPGIQQNWGKGIYWCPWCDGNEHADQPLGIFSPLNEAASQVQEISTLNSDIIAFVNGTDTPEMRAATDVKFPGWKEYLDARNIKVENRTIAGLVRLADGGANEHPEAPTFPEHDLFRVDFTEGPSIERAAFFASFPNKQHSSVGADMGVRLDGGRLAADPARGLMTNIPGVYAIGDANADNVTNVPHAMFSGKRAAVFLHVALARQETAALLAAHNGTSVEKRSLDLDPRAIWQDMNGGDADILDAGDFEQ
ncbi:sulphydryl oxidase [Xylaria digitata]|nr:sulphydryl oxidase [Xylaria digitata]